MTQKGFERWNKLVQAAKQQAQAEQKQKKKRLTTRGREVKTIE